MNNSAFYRRISIFCEFLRVKHEVFQSMRDEVHYERDDKRVAGFKKSLKLFKQAVR